MDQIDKRQTMTSGFVRRNFLVILIGDILLLSLAWYASYLVRFDFSIPLDMVGSFKKLLPLILVVKLASFYFVTSTAECGDIRAFPIY